MSDTCKFARKCQKGNDFEYGIIEIENRAESSEKRHYKILGKALSMQEALILNGMAIQGCEKIRPNVLPHFWD